MKQVIAILIVFNLFTYLSAQRSCILEVGDSCHVDNKNTQIRTSPNYNYKIIHTIDDTITDVIAEVLQAKVINGYVGVKLIISQADNSAIEHLEGQEGWIKKGYLQCYITTKTREFGTPSEEWNEDILLAENYKSRNLCKYSKDWHARLLLDRGRAYYAEEKYEDAERDISKAIDILRYKDDLCVFYWFRAHARSELGEFQEAIEDFDYIIDNKDSLDTDTCEFNLNDVLCWKAQNLYSLNENYKAKSILNIVIASDSECGFAYYLRGLVRYIINDIPGGCKDLNKAAELGFEEAFDELAAKCNGG